MDTSSAKQPMPNASIDGLDDVFEATVSELLAESSPILSKVLADREHTVSGYSLQEAADKLGVSKHTVRRWIKEGRLKALKVEGERGPEWRVPSLEQTVIEPSAHPDEDEIRVTNQPFANPDQAEASALGRVVLELSKRLESAAVRVTWLESEIQQRDDQLKLLPDLQKSAADSAVLKSENEQLRLQLEAKELELFRIRNTWWRKSFRWLIGGSDTDSAQEKS